MALCTFIISLTSAFLYTYTLTRGCERKTGQGDICFASAFSPCESIAKCVARISVAKSKNISILSGCTKKSEFKMYTLFPHIRSIFCNAEIFFSLRSSIRIKNQSDLISCVFTKQKHVPEKLVEISTFQNFFWLQYDILRPQKIASNKFELKIFVCLKSVRLNFLPTKNW